MQQEVMEIQRILQGNPLLYQVMKIASETDVSKVQQIALRLSKGELKGMRTEHIQIFQCFRENPPKPGKIMKKEQYFNETGLLQSEIVLDSGNHLIDGYTSYLLALKHGLEYVPIRYRKRQIVKAYHRQGGKIYMWELPGLLVDRVSPGERLIVETSRGLRTVRVALVEDCIDQEPGTYKKAVRKRKRGSYRMNYEVIRQVEMKNGDSAPLVEYPYDGRATGN